MARTQTDKVVGDLNLTQLKAERLAIVQKANNEISTRIKTIETALREIQEISEATGVDTQYALIYNLMYEHQPRGWNSSNC